MISTSKQTTMQTKFDLVPQTCQHWHEPCVCTHQESSRTAWPCFTRVAHTRTSFGFKGVIAAGTESAIFTCNMIQLDHDDSHGSWWHALPRQKRIIVASHSSLTLSLDGILLYIPWYAAPITRLRTAPMSALAGISEGTNALTLFFEVIL